MGDEKLINQAGHAITYAAIRQALGEAGLDRYELSLVHRPRTDMIDAVLNRGIDSHLEACFVPARGDRAPGSETRQVAVLDDQYVHVLRAVPLRLDLVISAKSFPTLLRRMLESGIESLTQLAGDILYSLGFNERGQYLPTGSQKRRRTYRNRRCQTCGAPPAYRVEGLPCWSHELSHAAQQHGWDLFNADGWWEIQKIDDLEELREILGELWLGPGFVSDEEAERFVWQQAQLTVDNVYRWAAQTALYLHYQPVHKSYYTDGT